MWRAWWGLLLLLLITLNINNWWWFPITRGFDARAHIEYIQYLQTHHLLPQPHLGWEYYQPPLYYWLASGLDSFKAVQELGVALWLGVLYATWVWLKKVGSDEWSRWAGVVVLAALPVGLYLNISISNEWAATAFISFSLLYYTGWYLPQLSASPKISSLNSLLLGLLLGLSLLTKATALLLPVTFLCERAWSTKLNLRMMIKQLAMPLLVAGLLSSWFYLRNVHLYDKLLVTPLDFMPLANFAQPIVPRDWRFFTDQTAVLKLDIYQAQHYSFWWGTYFSWLYDGHQVVAPVQTFSKAGMIIAGLGIPLLGLSWYGVLKALAHRQPLDLTLLIYSALLWMGYISYNFKIPLHSTVKGVFIASLLVPFVYFLLQGWHHLRWQPRWLAMLYITGWVAMIVKHFWIMSWWYPS